MSEASSLQRGLTRRSFLKTTALAAGAVAATGTTAGSLTALAEEDDSRQMSEEQVYYTGCSWGCYNCEYKLIVRDDKIVNIKAWQEEPRHCRPCLKGLGQIMRVYDPKRVLYPMRRVEGTERGAGEWERISWDDAISYVAEKWKGYIDEYGASSILVACVSALMPIVKRLGYTRLSNIFGFSMLDMCNDLSIGHGMDRTFGGGGFVYPANEAFDMTRADTVFLWGANMHVAHPQDFKFYLDAGEQGTRLVCVDPCYTVTASKADIWVPLRVGTDAALVLGLQNQIIQSKTYDEEFLLKYTVAPVLVREDTHRYLRMSDLAADPSPQTKASFAEDPFVVWDVDANAPAATSAENMALSGSFEIQGIKVRTAFDFQAQEAAQYTPEKVEEICGIPAEMVIELASYCTEGSVTHGLGLGPDHLDNGAHMGHAVFTLMALTGQVGKPGTGVEYSWSASVQNWAPAYPLGMNSATVAYDFMYDILETGEYQGKTLQPKSLFVAGCNPVASAPDQQRQMMELIPKIDFIVCVDPAMTDMAKYSDVVLPPAHLFESFDVQNSGYARSTQLCEKAIEPLFECKTDPEISRLLGKALSKGGELEAMGLFDWSDEEMVEQCLDTPQLTSCGISSDSLREKKVIRMKPEDYVASAEELILTTSGRIEFYVDDPKPRVDNGQSYDVDLERMGRFVPPTEAWPESDFMKTYPIVLLSERAATRMHSQGFGNLLLEEIYREPTADVNPSDAEARGVKNGDYAYFWNDRGHAVARVVLNEAVRPGVARYQKGWQDQHFKSGNWTWLTPSRFNPVTVNNSFFETAVDFRKWDGE